MLGHCCGGMSLEAASELGESNLPMKVPGGHWQVDKAPHPRKIYWQDFDSVGHCSLLCIPMNGLIWVYFSDQTLVKNHLWERNFLIGAIA